MERPVSGRLIGWLALCWCAAAPAAVPVWPLANEELIHNSRFWEAHGRGDLAHAALKKLALARPDLPEALLELGELDLRLNDFADAVRVENELARRFAGSSSAREFATEYRFATRDRLKLASIRRLIEIGRTRQAQVELKRLFPQGPPGAALGIDYYLLLASTPHGLASAYARLRSLAQRRPNDPRYQLALAQLMVRQRDSVLEGLRVLERLGRRDDVRTEDVDRLLVSGLLRLGPERAPQRTVNAYLARHPEDAEIAALRAEQARLAEEHELLSPEAVARVLPVLHRRLSKDLAAGAGSAEARTQARLWLDRSRASLGGGHERQAATEMRAALAFSRQDYEAQIALAQDLEKHGLTVEAGELLASAVRLAPQSTWLFETRVRWLISHGESSAAAEQLRTRALSPKWTAQSRDKWLAAALEQRASEEAAQGQLASAMTDLEAAISLAPRDVWMRYRLAEYYRGKGAAESGRALMSEGVQTAPDVPEMRYAQALYLSHLEDYAAAYTAIDGVDPTRRSEEMRSLHDRMRVALARANARRLKNAGDLAGARAALLDAEPVASHGIDRAAQLAYAWIELGFPDHGIGLVEPYVSGAGTRDPAVLLTWARVLNSADDTVRLGAVLAQLRARPRLAAAEHADVDRFQRALDLREIRELDRQGRFAEAARRLDALLAADPQNRDLRVRRADLYLRVGQSRVARDRYAALVAEDPDDLDTRLSYVRALTESGDLALARAQLEEIEARMPTGDEEFRIGLARRQLALGAGGKALATLQPSLAAARPRADVLMLAGHAELALRHFARAREYFEQATLSATGPEALAASRESENVADRLASSVTAGVMARHQPGTPGMSQIDLVTIPSAWVFANGYESRYTARADAIWLDAGRVSGAGQSSPLFGTIQAAGQGAAQRYGNGAQAGLSPAVGYQTDSLAIDLGSTPLGFLLPNIVGGIEWTPTWHSADLTLGVSRRGVTSSELSYAGLRDPVTGTTWGGVVQTGPYAGFGIYRENYDLSASVHLSEITGTRVLNNQFEGARFSSSWKLFSSPALRADAGVTVNYWNYQHDLSNYTFGSGGYYSPQSYVSLATPVELGGQRGGWVYKVRAAVSYSVSEVRSSAFYPDDAALQAAAARAPLPSGYRSPYFSGYHSTGFGASAYAAAERQVTNGLVVGVLFDIDRTDYYHPTTIALYLRHSFAPSVTRTVSPPRPTRPYSP
jgi:cellulose synthase operon protein C